MLDKMFIFAAAHPLLVVIFVVLVLLFVVLELRRGGIGISSQQLSDLINREDALVLDVRNADLFRKGHIHGSENVPIENFDAELERLVKLGDRPIVLVCELGNNAGTAGRKLMAKKLKRVYRLKGGLDAWMGNRLPLVKG